MASEFRTRRRIEFEDTDTAQIVHFARFYAFMEQAEHAFLRSLGLSVHMDWEGQRLGWPRLAASCEFLRPVRFEDEVDVHLTVKRKGTKSMTYAVEFEHGGEPVARGEITSVCCVWDTAGELTAIPIPELFACRLETHTAE
jgi:YbgC/YbaW family acyl-CoA thioester hydrolase